MMSAVGKNSTDNLWATDKLKRLLNPKTIAFVGGAPAQEAIRQCVKMGYQGEIWPVHPTLQSVEGYPVYRQIADLPAGPDACYIAVNRGLTVEIVAALAGKDAGGAVCYASGFRETLNNQQTEISQDESGVLLERKLLAVSADMPFFGPNCYGFINYLDGVILWPDQHGGRRLSADEVGVAIITQSSNLSINLTMQQRGLPLAYMLTAGNQSKVGLSDMALAVIEDPRVTALGLHIEGFDDIRQLEYLAQRSRELAKPIVMLKVGRSQQAQSNTLSHTASLAGSHQVSIAFAKHLGFANVDAVGDFIETLKLLHYFTYLESYHLNAMVCSGGEASIMADTAVGRKVDFPSLPEPTVQQLQNTLGPLVSISNPLDFHTYIWNDVEKMAAVFETMLQTQSDNVINRFALSIFIIDFPRADRCDPRAWYPPLEAMIIAIQRFQYQHGRLPRVAITASLPENLPETIIAEITEKYAIATFGSFAATLAAAEEAADIYQAWQQPLPDPLWLLSPVAAGSRMVVEESVAKQQLQQYGLSIPVQGVAINVEEAVNISEKLGYPVVCKARGIAHKTEADAVRLFLKDAAAVQQAAVGLLQISDSLLVESMIAQPVANPVGELLIGVTHSPPFGPVMTIGAGGILVELLQDSVNLLLPASEMTIHQSLQQLTISKCYDGFRGKPAWDIEAVIEAIQAVQSWVCDNQAVLLELDINPLLVCEKGVYAADALIVLAENGHGNSK
jgi:acyl-CoA synthetase (NDP forming)